MKSIFLFLENQIPLNIFNKAKDESGEYRNYSEYLQYVKRELNNSWFKNIKIPNTYKLLFAYGNGDYLFFDIKSKKFYDFNHETLKFEPSQYDLARTSKG